PYPFYSHIINRPFRPTPCTYTTLFRSIPVLGNVSLILRAGDGAQPVEAENLYIDVADLNADATFTNIDIGVAAKDASKGPGMKGDRKSTRLNSSHVKSSYAVFCLKKKT